jgi:signal transduction histidine kinase
MVGNLVSNAMRYSADGGEPTIGVHWDASHAVLTVADERIGIPSADLRHISEAHWRGGNVEGRVHGTGMGLARSKQIIEQHGGSISVERVEGRGSVFTVRIPLAQ